MCTFSTSERQKEAQNPYFLHFWLGNTLRATRSYTFSTSGHPKVVRTWCALYILTWKRASRHNCVHFFDIATSKTGLKLVCFVHFDFEMCFEPQQRAIFNLSSGQLAPHPPLQRAHSSTLRSPKSLEKNTLNRDFPTFSRTCVFFPDLLTSFLLFSDSSPPLLFQLSIFSEVSLRNFLRSYGYDK